MAAVKLESENSEYARARRLLEKARASAPTARVWMKSARLEWCLGDLHTASVMLEEGCLKYPNAPKLHMMRGQLAQVLAEKEKPESAERETLLEKAREAFKEGVSFSFYYIFRPLQGLVKRMHTSNALKFEKGRNLKLRILIVISSSQMREDMVGHFCLFWVI